MKLLLAVMISSVALSAQAELKKCDTDDCKAERFMMKLMVNNDVTGTAKSWFFETPSGKKIPFSILDKLPEPVEVLKSDEAGATPLIYSPKASCEQLYVLYSFYRVKQVAENDTSQDGGIFYLKEIYDKCPSIYAELAKKYSMQVRGK